MNDRFLEIAKQAKLKFPSDAALSPMEEKFAELIVQECAKRVEGSVVRDKGYIPQDPHSRGWNDAVAYAGKELKQYFGVNS